MLRRLYRMQNRRMADDLPNSPAAERNKQPILDTLRRILPARGTVLEIASGTGQHAVWFGAGLRSLIWQPTDADPAALAGIGGWIHEAGLTNVRAPLLLDVTAPRWPSHGTQFSEPFDAVYCANMVHIAPWPCCTALMQGSARHLALDGLLVLYGPFFEEGAAPAPGNVAFDESLRQRNPQWGVRRLADVVTQANNAGLRLQARHQMPANNLVLVFGRGQ
jgi:Protein of unknown function (DUF938)